MTTDVTLRFQSDEQARTLIEDVQAHPDSKILTPLMENDVHATIVGITSTPKYPQLVIDRGREWALEAETKLLDLHNNVLLSHQSIDLLEQVLDVRRTLNACPKCGSIRDEPCLSGGYLPVGELPGDELAKPHRQRKARR